MLLAFKRGLVKLIALFVVICNHAISQECVMPCAWRGKNFNIYAPTVLAGNGAMFDTTGGSFDLSDIGEGVVDFTCFQIYGEFMIIRYLRDGAYTLRCIALDYSIEEPVRFTFGLANVFLADQSTSLSQEEICSLCSNMFANDAMVAQDSEISETPPSVALPCSSPYNCTAVGFSVECVNLGEVPIGGCDVVEPFIIPPEIPMPPTVTTTTSAPEIPTPPTVPTTTSTNPDNEKTDKSDYTNDLNKGKKYYSKRYRSRKYNKNRKWNRRGKGRRYHYGYYSRRYY